MEKEKNTLSKEQIEENLRREAKLLKELFPELNIDDIPDEVWERCKEGNELAREYAFYLIRRHNEENRAQKVNEKNTKSAPPKMAHDGGEEAYFTPEAVSRMSEKDIEKNYSAIMKSMEKWK